jgi:anti-sigma factor RsiW
VNDGLLSERGFVSDSRLHLSDWTLDQLAEGELPADERSMAERHVDGCPACSARLATCRNLFTALSALPRFEPSHGFADAVLARTRMQPEPGLLAQWLRWATPTTRRGWALLIAALAAPALPILIAAVWLLTHPALTVEALWEWTLLRMSTSARAAGDVAAGWADGTGASMLITWGYSIVNAVPLAAVTAVLVVLAVAIPLSAWALFRLVRTPNRNITYAN